MINSPKISVVVLGYKQGWMTIACIKSIFESVIPWAYEVIYVANGTKESEEESLVRQAFDYNTPNFKVVSLVENRLFAGGMNAGIIKARGEIIFCLNNDTIIDKNCLKEVCIAMQDEAIGCANTKILRYGTNKLDMSVCKLKLFNLIPYSVDYGVGDLGQVDKLIPDYATGCAIAFNTEALAKVGLFDESYGMYWEDVDLSFRMKRAGYKIGFIPKAIVWHRGGASVKKIPWKTRWYINKNRIKFFLKCGGRKCY